MEKEAKFIVPDRSAYERLDALERIGPYERRGTTLKNVSDRYVDTPDHSFSKHGYYMRLRAAKGGNGSTLVTIKSTGAVTEGAIHSRDEYQIEVSDLDSATWPEGEVRSMTEEIRGGQPLTDLVTIGQARKVSTLFQGERPVAELSLDDIMFETTGEPARAYEVEVELLPTGLDADLRILARVLSEEYSLAPQPLSKFERAIQEAPAGGGKHPKAEKPSKKKSRRMASNNGHEPSSEPLPEAAAAAPEPAKPAEAVPAPKPDKPAKRARTAAQKEPEKDNTEKDKKEMGVLPTDSMGAAGRKIVSSYFKAMLDNEEGTRTGEDPESLHDMRVATRRMRAALQVVEPYLASPTAGRVQRGLRTVTRALGEVRDRDVLIGKAQAFRDQLPADRQDDMSGLLDRWQVERDRARKKLLRLLDSKEYTRFKKQMNAFLKEQPEEPDLSDAQIEPYQVRHAAGSAIWDRYEEIRAFETVMDNPTLTQIHALRIKGKYLRYTLECFREALPEAAGPLIRDVVNMQDQLGELHDADVAGGLIRTYAANRTRKKPKKQTEAEQTMPQGLAVYLEQQEAAMRRIQADFAATWANLDSPAWRIRLATAVASM